MKFGEKLRLLRNEKGLTQAEFSKILHVSRTTISSWETGRTYPDLELLVQLSDFYNISLDILLREDMAMVKNISKDMKKSKLYKRWLFALVSLFILIAGAEIYIYKNNLLNYYYEIKPEELLSVEFSENPLKKLAYSENLTLTIKKEWWREIYIVNPVEVDGTIYIPVGKKSTIIPKPSKTITIRNDAPLVTDFENAKRIVLVFRMSEKEPQDEPVSQQKTIWEKEINN